MNEMWELEELERQYKNDMIKRTISQLSYQMDGNVRVYIPSDRDREVYGIQEIKVDNADIILCNQYGEFWFDRESWKTSIHRDSTGGIYKSEI